jgi:hypothetical protein
MPRMGRPKTDASAYERFPARLPQDVMQELRHNAARFSRPVNTELVLLLRYALAMQQQTSKETHELLPASTS